jgi:hypothetical protein
MMIVAVNNHFSRPLLVWYAELQLSDPPKAPPTCEPVRWSSMAATKSTDRIIWIYGRRDFIDMDILAWAAFGCNLYAILFLL